MYTQQATASQAEIFTMSYGNNRRNAQVSQSHSANTSQPTAAVVAYCIKLMEVECMNEHT